jgi:hypothetical protein
MAVVLVGHSEAAASEGVDEVLSATLRARDGIRRADGTILCHLVD